MENERMKILNLVSEGKLTVEEATLLLQSLGQGETPPAPPAPPVKAPVVPVQPVRVEAIAAVPAVPAAPAAPVEPVTAVTEASDLAEPAYERVDGAGPELENGFWSWIQHLVTNFIPREEYIEEYDWRFDPASISTISAETTNGTVTLTGSERDQILVHARKVVKGPSVAAAKEFAERVQIIVQEEDGSLNIRKEHPKLSMMRFQVEVAYEIKCPPRMNADLQTTNGKIEVERVHGTLQTWTTNGKVQIEKSGGRVQAGTTNGSVEVELEKLEGASKFSTTNGSVTVNVRQGNAPIEARTVNGSINLALPANFSGNLEASTVNGRVDTELPMSLKNVSRRHLAGQIGSGGETTIQLHTVNGSVRLEKQPEATPEMQR